MSGKMFSCSQVPKWIIISAPLHTNIKRQLLFPEVHLLVFKLSFLWVFLCFLRDNKLLSCVTTVLTQPDLPGVEIFWIFPFWNVAFTPQKGNASIVFRHVKQNGLIRMGGYHSYCVLICFSQCGSSVSLNSLLAANVWEQTKMLHRIGALIRISLLLPI